MCPLQLGGGQVPPTKICNGNPAMHNIHVLVCLPGIGSHLAQTGGVPDHSHDHQHGGDPVMEPRG